MKSPVLKALGFSALLGSALLAARPHFPSTRALRDAVKQDPSVVEILDKAKDSAEPSVAGRLLLEESPTGRMVQFMDLHTHSYCSDGDKSPEALLQEAKDAGLVFYALTDHDTSACLPRAQAKARELGVNLIPGIEVSAEDDSMHILALGIDPQAPGVAAITKKADVERAARMLAIVEKLPQSRPAGAPLIDLKTDVLLPKLNRELRIDGKQPLSPDQASKATVDHLLSQIRGQITRPDIARALVAKKWAVDNQDAFNRFLNPGHPAYVPMNGPSFREVIKAVHAAGGIAVWAHPYTIYKFKKTPWVFSGKNYRDFETLAQDMLEAGLDGFQLYTPGWERFADHKVPAFVEAYRKKSGKQVLLTPGSDYHGGKSSGIGPQTMGGMSAPDHEVSKILSRL